MILLDLALLLALLVAASAAVWLAMDRVRAYARAAAAEAARQADAANLADARAELDRLTPRLEDALAQARDHELTITRLQGQMAKADEVHAERQAALERREADLKRSIAQLTEDFRAVFGRLSGDALRANTEQFLKLADSRLKEQHTAAAAELEQRKTAVDALIKPMGETLRRTEEKLAGFAAATGDLRAETARLAHALSRPEVRGRYGEIQLRRVAELAGMVPYCDFQEQAAARDTDGRLQRPDLIVRLPNDRVIVVDAKCNIDAYVRAADVNDPAERERLLAKFADDVAEQVGKLAAKNYWSSWEGSPEFVVMFVPGDHFLDAALARRSGLFEHAAQHAVILVTPGSLIGLLRAVAVGWREKRLEDQARELFTLGRELHERAAVAFEHFASLGQAIEHAARSYNSMAGSIEARMLPTLRKFEDAGAKSAKTIPELPNVAEPLRRAAFTPANPPAD